MTLHVPLSSPRDLDESTPLPFLLHAILHLLSGERTLPCESPGASPAAGPE